MHVILGQASRYSVRNRTVLHEGYSYNIIGGYWESDVSGTPLVFSECMECIATKKEDIETGEDHKGE